MREEAGCADGGGVCLRRAVVEQVHGSQKPLHPRMLVAELDIVPLAHGDEPCKHHALSSVLPHVRATFLARVAAYLCG